MIVSLTEDSGVEVGGGVCVCGGGGGGSDFCF